MANLNRVQIMGNLGKDPESRYTGSGKMIVSFSVAVNNTWKDANGEKKTNTEWVNVEAWGRLAEIINQYAKKGSSVYLEGRLKTDKFEDKNGDMKYFTKVIASSVQFLGGGSNNGSNQSQEVTQEDPDENIPF